MIDSVYAALAPRQDFYASGNMFVYYSLAQVKNRDFRGPDVFVALGVDGQKERQGWVVWEEDGKYPDVIMELMSPSTAEVDVTTKKQIYEHTFSTKQYFVYDPFDVNSLRGWERQRSGFVELQPNAQGWLWCEALGLWLGTWQGQVLQEKTDWLRLYFPNEQLVLLPQEQAAQELAQVNQELIQARQKQAALREKLQELGVDPDTL
jgi:Uma2 family endonuclease